MRMTVNGIIRYCMAAVMALALATPATLAANAPIYDINVILPLTGSLAFSGQKQLEAIKVAETVVNRNGGIDGRPVHFVVHDDASTPTTTVQLTSELMGSNVPVILGSTLAATCAAMFPLVQKSGPVTYCYSPVVHPKDGGYSFMSAPAIADVQPVVLRYFRSKGRKRLAIITSTDASGEEFEQRFDATVQEPEFRDMTVVDREHFNPTDISVTAQMARIKAAKPDVLITFSTGTPFGTLLHGINDAGLDVPVYGSGGNMSYAQMKQYKAFLPKELYLNAARGVTPDPSAKGKMLQAQRVYFAAMKAAGIRPEFSHSLTWDPTMLVVDALRHLGPNATAEQLHEYLEHLRGWVGIEGTYDFTSGNQRGVGQAAAALFRWDASKGDWVMVSS